MTTNLITRKGSKLQLNGNQLSGDTFAIKGYIKAYLGGRWDAASRAWTIDTGKLDEIMSLANSIGLRIDTSAAPVAETRNDRWFVNTRTGRELAQDY